MSGAQTGQAFIDGRALLLSWGRERAFRFDLLGVGFALSKGVSALLGTCMIPRAWDIPIVVVLHQPPSCLMELRGCLEGPPGPRTHAATAVGIPDPGSNHANGPDPRSQEGETSSLHSEINIRVALATPWYGRPCDRRYDGEAQAGPHETPEPSQDGLEVP
jgi:hypothetical protein